MDDYYESRRLTFVEWLMNYKDELEFLNMPWIIPDKVGDNFTNTVVFRYNSRWLEVRYVNRESLTGLLYWGSGNIETELSVTRMDDYGGRIMSWQWLLGGWCL